MRNKKMMTISVFVSLGIILSYVEHLLPTQFLMAGAKLGLANIVTVVTLVLLDKKSSLLILLLRICLVSLLFSGFSGFLYSLAGGMFAYLTMLLMLKIDFKDVSLVGVSVVGSVFHGFGQVVIASVLFQNYKILLYFPSLLLTALITGIFIGLISNYLTERLIKAAVI
ncbi:Gx transporter family protein [Acidaminobacter sp. JC074]|uniref:Gx transporter family protein n=1 Tax=Acidaminobacter sp. JC074 TaxID=2530199 RepID=UPI001F0D9227|nr:Gx transporter family protein [Acidaminobacter sp. JC074]MCH4890601.1 Gx transporter family protein [Acidaminobacter sp. JC074]